MIAKAGKTPRERLLGLFDILGDWLDAPHTSEKFNSIQYDAVEFEAEAKPLLEYLTSQAQASGVQEAETLARQLYFMCVSMLQEDLRSPGGATCQHAKHVAQALIRAQTETDRVITKRSAYALVASVFFATGLTLFVVNTLKPFESETITAITPTPAEASNKIVTNTKSVKARPEQTAALFATIEQMRKGQCHYPEALQLPDAHKAIYLTNVVNGQISTDAEDQRLVLQLLKKVNCNYAPMLMKNSVG